MDEVNILFDTNVILDVLLNRQPLIEESKKVWQANLNGRVKGYITAPTLLNIYYYATKKLGSEKGAGVVEICLQAFQICAVDRKILEQAWAMKGRDFEDDVQAACALAEGLDAIVTRNIKDFKNAGIKLYTPEQLVKKLKLR